MTRPVTKLKGERKTGLTRGAFHHRDYGDEVVNGVKKNERHPITRARSRRYQYPSNRDTTRRLPSNPRFIKQLPIISRHLVVSKAEGRLEGRVEGRKRGKSLYRWKKALKGERSKVDIEKMEDRRRNPWEENCKQLDFEIANFIFAPRVSKGSNQAARFFSFPPLNIPSFFYFFYLINKQDRTTGRKEREREKKSNAIDAIPN